MLTKEEQQIVDYGKSHGMSQQQTITALAKYRATAPASTAQLPKKQGYLAETIGDIKEIGSDVKSSIQGSAEAQREILDADANKKQSKLSSIFQTATNLASGVVGVGANIIKGGVKAFLPQSVEDKVGQGAQKATEQVLKLPAVKTLMANYEEMKKSDPVKARNVLALSQFGEFLLNFYGLEKAGSMAVKGGELAERGVAATREAVTVGAERAGQAISTAGEGIRTGLTKVGDVAEGIVPGVSGIPRRIGVNIAEKQAAEIAIKQLPSDIAQAAVRDGVNINDVKELIAATVKPAERKAITELATTVKNFANRTGKVNPMEVVGTATTKLVERAAARAEVIGKQLGAVADKLPSVTSKEIQPVVVKELQRVPGMSGLKVAKNGSLDFKATSLSELSQPVRNKIETVFQQAIASGSGKSKHLFRQELFEILDGAKKSLQNITGTEERAFQAVRKALADVLDAKSTTYKDLNLKFAKLSEPRRELERLLKTIPGEENADLRNMAAGLLTRRLTSHAPSGVQFSKILRDLEKLVGTTDDVSPALLQDVYNILDKYYDIVGDTSFKGQIKTAIEGSSPTEILIRKAKALAGETPVVRQRALEKLLDSLVTK